MPDAIRRDGTVLGFDVGARRIGVAVGSPRGPQFTGTFFQRQSLFSPGFGSFSSVVFR